MNPSISSRTLSRRARQLAAPFLFVVLAAPIAGCGSDDTSSSDTSASESTDSTAEAGSITIDEAWSRQPAEGQTATAVYGVLTNDTDEDVTVVSATSDVSDDVQLHETIEGDDGAMQMVEREEGFVVPAGGSFTFEPGGPHIMLLGVDAASYPDEVSVTLEFDKGDPLTFTAEVRKIAGGDDMSDMSESDMSESDMSESDMSESDMSESKMSAVDPAALHELDEALTDGTLDAATQVPVVDAQLAALAAKAPAAGSPEAALATTLTELKAALTAGDAAKAAGLAKTAHEQAHDLEDQG